MDCYLRPICFVLSDMNLERRTSQQTRRWTRKEEEKSGRRRTPLRAGTAGLQAPALPACSPRHCRPQAPGTAGLLTPALPASRPRHCRALQLKTRREPRPALPAWNQRHCRPNRHCRPILTGTAGPTPVDFISTVDFASMDQDNLCNSDFTPVRIWVYKYLTPSSRLGLEMN